MKAFLTLCFVAAAVADSNVYLQQHPSVLGLGSPYMYNTQKLYTTGALPLSAGVQYNLGAYNPSLLPTVGYSNIIGATKTYIAKREAEAEADPLMYLNSGAVLGSSMYSQPIVQSAFAQPALALQQSPLMYNQVPLVKSAVAVPQPALYAASIDKYQVNGPVFRKDSIDLATGRKIHQANSAGVQHTVFQKREAEAEPIYPFSSISPLSYHGVQTVAGSTVIPQANVYSTGVTGYTAGFPAVTNYAAYNPLVKTYSTCINGACY